MSLSERLNEICSENRGVDSDILCNVVELGLEIAREGREGRKIGTLFVLGDDKHVIAAASITLQTDAVAVVVSESSVVRIFDEGEIIAEIIPEVWLLQRASRRLQDSQVEEFEKENVTLVSEKPNENKEE